MFIEVYEEVELKLSALNYIMMPNVDSKCTEDPDKSISKVNIYFHGLITAIRCNRNLWYSVVWRDMPLEASYRECQVQRPMDGYGYRRVQGLRVNKGSDKRVQRVRGTLLA